MAVEDLNKVSYTDQDWQTAIDGIQGFLQTNYADTYNDYVAGNMGQALIDILGYAVQNLNWLLNRKVTDLYFPTAVTPNAVSKISRMLGYKPKGATGSIVSLTVTLPSGPYLFPVSITKGFQFQGPQGLIFEYRQTTPVTYNPGDTVKTFEVREGESKTLNFVSDGTTNQIFKILNIGTDKYVEQGTVEVRVNGELWTEYDIIPFSTTNSYETNLLASVPFVKFGDSVQGNVPAAGAAIEVKYIVVSGFRGRIVTESIKKAVRPLVSNFTSIPFSISQPAASAGGDDPEDLRSIVVNAPKFQRTQDRAITKGDYDFLSNQFPNVAKGDAQCLRSVTGDIYINGQYSAIYDTLNLNNEIAYSLSGYGDIPAEVVTASGAMLSISGTMPGFTTVQNNVTSVINAQTTLITTRTSQSNAQLATLLSIPSASAVAVTVSGYMLDINSYVTEIIGVNTSASGFGAVSGYVNSVSGDLLQIDSDLVSISGFATNTQVAANASSYSQTVSGHLANIYDYLDYHFADGCRGNLVQVSIVSKDSNRKFVDPAPSTLTSLKTYLDERKDAVHTLSVISGTARVIDANVLIELKLTDAADPEDVVGRVSDVIQKSDVEPLGILVEREYNDSLYLSEIYDAIDSVVESFEIVNTNVIIQGPVQYLDSRGNLICPDGYVIQTGTITITLLD